VQTVAPRLATAAEPGSSSADQQSGRGRFYDLRVWRDEIRPQKLRRDPLCEACLERDVTEPATEVDHIDGNPRNNLPENHRSLCKPCHSTKTGRERGIGRIAGDG
jgi:5-methylcytosine-specific restriction enzyme A